MTTLMAIVAVVLGSAGAFVLYLGSPNQSLLAQPLASLASGSACVVGLLGSLLLFLQLAGPATSVYLLLTVVMLTWSIPPLAVGWWRQRGSREP